MSRNDTLNGAMTGIAIAAAAHWARYDDDTQRRLRNVRLDTEEALDLIRSTQSRGEVLRSKLGPVQDAQVGLALASPAPVASAVVPSTTPTIRPDITSQMEAAVCDMQWPPASGSYDDKGLVKQAGELTSMFLALTYEEVRAFVQGLAQSKMPNCDAKLQIFYAANALVAQLGGQKLTWQEYKDAWARMFGLGPLGGSNNHNDTAKAPVVLSKDPGITSVVPRGLPDLVGYQLRHNNTDRASKWRMTVGNANVNAGTANVAFRFGSPYFGPDGQPFEPAIGISSGQFFVATVDALGFVLNNNQALLANTIYDFSIVVAS